MKYKKNILNIENLSTAKLANRFGTPLYCYSLNKLLKNIEKFKKNIFLIFFLEKLIFIYIRNINIR